MKRKNKKLTDRFFESGWGIVAWLCIALELAFLGAIWTKVFIKWWF